MNKLGLFAFAAQFAPQLFQVRRRTWVAVGVGLLALAGLLIWTAATLIGWFFGQAQGLVGAAPEAVRRAMALAEQSVPGAREKLSDFIPTIKPSQPRRDVSGTDLGPVARYPGLARTYWHRADKQVTIEYEGEADYAAVLDHYAKGFAAQGFAQSLQSATPATETHEYTKGAERITLKIAQLPKGAVSARIESPLQ